MPGRTIKQPILGQPLDIHRGGEGSFPKPGELIDVIEMVPLSLTDRRVFNLLLVNAWPRITEDREHIISKIVLKQGHGSTDRLSDTLKRLMASIIEVQIIRGGRPTTRRIQLLG